MSASRFVNNRAEGENRAASPSARTVNLSDRSGAKSLKFGRQATSGSKLASTSPAPGYASNPSASRNTFSGNQQYPQQASDFASGLDNVSVASDFDATITSDMGVQRYAEQDRYYGDEEIPSDEVEPPATMRSQIQTPYQHRLQHKQSHSPMIDQIAEPEPRRHGHSGSISGRFDGHQSQIENLAVRSFESNGSSRSDQGSRASKRSRSAERNQPSVIFEERSSQLDNLEDDNLALPEPNPLPEVDEHEDNFETPSNSPRKHRRAQNLPQPAARANQLLSPLPKPIPDYNDETLKKMAYADLEKEPWEKSDYKKSFQLVKPLRDTSSLKEKLDHYTFKEVGQDAQVAFFTQLSLEEWEEGGDWFVDKFTEMMTEMKKKRMEKKQIAKKYEDEISAREKLVRGKSDHLDREFKDMRTGGEGILRGKRV